MALYLSENKEMCYNSFMTNYEKLSRLRNKKSVCLIGHIEPDADALSSMIVLREFLINHFKVENVDIFGDYNNLPSIYEEILDGVQLNPEIKNYETAIMIDSPNTDRLGKFASLFNSANNKIVIDHHATNQNCGEINIVEMCSSTCEIIYSILQYFHYEISKENQGKLYAGIITDTNNFTVGNYNKRTFEIAGACIENINKTQIFNAFLSSNSLRQMQLIAMAIQNLNSYQNGQIIISKLSVEEISKYNATSDDCSVVINKLATISGNKLVCFIYPSKDQFYVSMRAKDGYDVSKIATRNGGGGHKGAAAFLSNKPIEKIKLDIAKAFTNELEKGTLPHTKLFK